MIRPRSTKTLSALAALVNARVSNVSIVAGVVTLDRDNGSIFVMTLDANITSMVVANVPGDGDTFSLYILGDDGAFTVAYPSGIKWTGGGEPVLSQPSNTLNEIIFSTYDGGSTWIGHPAINIF